MKGQNGSERSRSSAIVSGKVIPLTRSCSDLCGGKRTCLAVIKEQVPAAFGGSAIPQMSSFTSWRYFRTFLPRRGAWFKPQTRFVGVVPENAEDLRDVSEPKKPKGH